MIVQKTFRIKGGREFFYPLLHPFCIPIKKLFFESISSSPPFHIPFHFRVWNRGIPDDATKWIRWRKNLWKRKGGRKKNEILKVPFIYLSFLYICRFSYISVFFFIPSLSYPIPGFLPSPSTFLFRKKNLLKWKIWWRQGKGKMHWSQFWRKDANLAWFKSFFNSNEI